MSEPKVVRISQAEMAVRIMSAFVGISPPSAPAEVALAVFADDNPEQVKRWIAAADVAIEYMGECLGAECEFIGPFPNENPADVGISPMMRGKKVQA